MTHSCSWKGNKRIEIATALNTALIYTGLQSPLLKAIRSYNKIKQTIYGFHIPFNLYYGIFLIPTI